MDKATKVLLNSLRCPVCNGQIDMFDGKAALPRSKYNFACAANHKDYSIYLKTNDPSLSYIEEEVIQIIEKNHLYMVGQFHSPYLNMHRTIVAIKEVNGDGNIIEGKSFKELTFPKSLFDFRNTNRTKLLNRIKTILVFQ